MLLLHFRAECTRFVGRKEFFPIGMPGLITPARPQEWTAATQIMQPRVSEHTETDAMFGSDLVRLPIQAT